MANRSLAFYKEIELKSSEDSVFPEDVLSYSKHPCWLYAVYATTRGVSLLMSLFSLIFFPLVLPNITSQKSSLGSSCFYCWAA